ncbi:MAG TPA: PQQ-binding-like beta-propeller repeat protein, partial [Vicinamibacterales bacterium]|nr:PQQ-binding-like beta-propeller repeat protein [Vicinamibacterales bacterium]
MTARIRFALVLACSVALASLHLQGQVPPDVSYERLIRAAREPQNWLTYSGSYLSQRYSPLDQINLSNVKNLEQKWAYQGAVVGPWQATPLVVDGVMYVTQRPNDVVALDARTGRVFWIYQHVPAADHKACCGSNNRGLAILGDTLFLGTLDARLVAINAKTGRRIWDTTVADYRLQYALTVAPLVVKDKVIIGVGGGDRGIRGFIAAYDARTGKEAWRFYTIPGPGEPGHETWQRCPPSSSSSVTSPAYCDPEAWAHGGGSIWLTGSYDPDLNLTYWGIGNVWPDFNPNQRPGDNLYTESVVALDADTGRLRWHFQFTPNGAYDYDSVQIPVLADVNLLGGSPAKVMLWANRNGFFYVLDRATGRFLLGRPFVKVNWASDLDERGRPIPTPQSVGSPTFPGVQGGTNWYSPSFSPRTGLFYVSAWEDYATLYDEKIPVPYTEGKSTAGGGIKPYVPVRGARSLPGLGRGPINNWTEAAGHGAVKAIDPRTGTEKWKFYMTDVSASGILTTASDLLFTGGREGY